MSQHEQHAATARALGEVALGAPPFTVTGIYLCGHPIADWAAALTALYTLGLLVRLAWTWPRRNQHHAN